jgi:hypothetical protein
MVEVLILLLVITIPLGVILMVVWLIGRRFRR